MTAEFRRLGKRGSYRLGQLRAQGISEYQPPAPFQPHFVRPDHRWPAAVWLLGLLAGSVIIMAGAQAGWWFAPFVVGAAAGLANWVGGWRLRVALPAVVVMAAIGWAAPLAWSMVSSHESANPPALRQTVTTLGLPRYAAVGIALTVLVAVAQSLAGYWLGRALTPRPANDLAVTHVGSAFPCRRQIMDRAVLAKDSTQPAGPKLS